MTWMTFSLNGRDYKVTLDRLSIAEAREVKRYTGVTLTTLMLASSGHVDGDVLAAIVYLAKRRAGEDIDWAEIDQIDVVELLGSMAASADEPGQDGQADAAEPPSASNGKRPARQPRKAAPKPQQDQEPAATT